MAPDSQNTIILRIGAEGGGISVTRSRVGSGWRFAVRVADCTADLLDEPVDPEREMLAASWADVLKILDRYPWARLVPLEVHPEFRQPVLNAVTQRLSADDERESGALNRWKRVCRT